MVRNYTRTCLEEKMSKILSSLKIDFQEQVSTRSGFVIDFTIYLDNARTNKIAIETDGTNWHSSSKAKQRDRFRDMILRKEGWTVIRFGEEFTADEVLTKLHETGLM